MTLTEPQRAALKWLRDRGGTGMFGKEGVLLAKGEWAPFMRSTWKVLRDEGFITLTNKRVNVTPPGYVYDVGITQERLPINKLGQR